MEKIKCKHLDCTDTVYSHDLCKFHIDGGVFGTGETYEQYQVLEEDFINFIKIIPLSDSRNMIVCSPVLRDLIIRCCVQIEIFFKEWAKFECAKDDTLELAHIYNKGGKGVRNWNIRHYHYFKNKYIDERALYIRELNIKTNPFSSWEVNAPPQWWQVYNSIKHGGLNSGNECNLDNTLKSLSALFLLHCANNYSRRYLEQFNSIKAVQKTFGKIRINFDRIKTPLDSKKYLFQDVFGSARSLEISDAEEILLHANRNGKNV